MRHDTALEIKDHRNVSSSRYTDKQKNNGAESITYERGQASEDFLRQWSLLLFQVPVGVS